MAEAWQTTADEIVERVQAALWPCQAIHAA